VNYVGIDWSYGSINVEGLVPADEDGLAKLVLHLGTEVEACC
jgi:hypothetical protein